MNGYRVLRSAFLQADSAIINKGCIGDVESMPKAGVIVAALALVSDANFAPQQQSNATDGSGTASGGEDAGSNNHSITVVEGSSAAHPDRSTAPISGSTLLVWSMPPAVLNSWRFSRLSALVSR
ncbi:MAG: hypothetical protein JXJ17_12625 [Anaerolineae bacterium]|nr:hypothetical protein [Anaerolineae bacterium]